MPFIEISIQRKNFVCEYILFMVKYKYIDRKAIATFKSVCLLGLKEENEIISEISNILMFILNISYNYSLIFIKFKWFTHGC